MYAWFMVAREMATQQLAREDAKRATRDSDWIARELGDVPHDRIVGITRHDNPLTWAAPHDTPYLGIPVESLGRDQ